MPATEPHASAIASWSRSVRPPNSSSVAIIAAFQPTGARYASRKRPWLFRTPRHQAEATRIPAPGNRIRTRRTASSRFSPVNPGATSSTSSGAARTPSRTSTAIASGQEREERPRHLRRGLVLAARPQRGMHRNERSGQRAFAEQVLQQVGDAEGGVERVDGDAVLPELARDQPHPQQPGEAADQDAGANRGVRPRHPPQQSPRTEGHERATKEGGSATCGGYVTSGLGWALGARDAGRDWARSGRWAPVADLAARPPSRDPRVG